MVEEEKRKDDSKNDNYYDLYGSLDVEVKTNQEEHC